jgi:hypothetical protein
MRLELGVPNVHGQFGHSHVTGEHIPCTNQVCAPAAPSISRPLDQKPTGDNIAILITILIIVLSVLHFSDNIDILLFHYEWNVFERSK